MKSLKTGILASIAGLLVITAMMAVFLAIIYATSNSPWYLLYALIAIPAGIGGKLLFWVTEYKN